jgi:protein SCO1
MRKKWLFLIGFFVVLLTAFYVVLFNIVDFSASKLPVINANVKDFSFINQEGKIFSEKEIDGKVYVADFFFTTCRGICPRMNANMRRVFDAYKNESNFMVLSHTCMPETDSIPRLRAYAQLMLTGKLTRMTDGTYRVSPEPDAPLPTAKNWVFLTGDKTALYNMARQSYLIDNNQQDTAQKISDQFIHTQFFALVDKQRRVRGIYDGLKEEDVQKLLKDIPGLLKEKRPNSSFTNGFSNTPN